MASPFTDSLLFPSALIFEGEHQTMSETTGVDLVVLCMAQCVQLGCNCLIIIDLHCGDEAIEVFLEVAVQWRAVNPCQKPLVWIW